MKQVITYMCLVILAISAVIVIRLNQKPRADKAITISQYYSVMDPFQGIDVPLYLTNDEHLLTNMDAYQSIYLINEDSSKKLALTLSNISIDGEENYLNDIYTTYMLEFELPVLNDDYWIANTFLEITLLNGINYLFEIGSFSYMDIKDDVDYMFWTSLEAIKEIDVSIARIKEIAISFDTLSQTIKSVSIGLNQELDYTISNQLLTITIDHDDQLLYACPIAITYIDDQTQIIDYFSYLRENAILYSSGVLNHVYNVNIAS